MRRICGAIVSLRETVLTGGERARSCFGVNFP